jgi:hypothetical protein
VPHFNQSDFFTLGVRPQRLFLVGISTNRVFLGGHFNQSGFFALRVRPQRLFLIGISTNRVFLRSPFQPIGFFGPGEEEHFNQSDFFALGFRLERLFLVGISTYQAYCDPTFDQSHLKRRQLSQPDYFRSLSRPSRFEIACKSTNEDFYGGVFVHPDY